jgi:hypothetical protein
LVADKPTSLSKIGKVTGSMFGHIGSLTSTDNFGNGGEGYGKLSGSLDDFGKPREVKSKLNKIGLLL